MEIIRFLGSNETLLGVGFIYGFVWWLPRDRQILANFPLSSLLLSSFTGLISSGFTFAVGSMMRLSGCSWVATIALGIASLYQLGIRLGDEDPRQRSRRNGWNGY